MALRAALSELDPVDVAEILIDLPPEDEGVIFRVLPRDKAAAAFSYLPLERQEELVQSLSVGGVDGTTRNRFRGSPAAERVRAKTGTLQGKSCLSGYVGDGHEILVFSILVDGLRGRFPELRPDLDPHFPPPLLPHW